MRTLFQDSCLMIGLTAAGIVRFGLLGADMHVGVQVFHTVFMIALAHL